MRMRARDEENWWWDGIEDEHLCAEETPACEFNVDLFFLFKKMVQMNWITINDREQIV